MSQALSLQLRDLLTAGEPVALVEVAVAKGSTPREAGVAMLVTDCRLLRDDRWRAARMGGDRRRPPAAGAGRRPAHPSSCRWGLRSANVAVAM